MMLAYADNRRQSASKQFHDTNSETKDDQRFLPMTPPGHHYLSLEELKQTQNSCWLCGCDWLEDHVSLDCPECGGYALTRPCPTCDGKCKQVWSRNINATHNRHRALWVGKCQSMDTSSAPATKASFRSEPMDIIGCKLAASAKSQMAPRDLLYANRKFLRNH